MDRSPAPSSTWNFNSIGVFHTPFQDRASAPRQPAEAAWIEGEIELFEGRNYEHALEDLSEWSHLWVIFVFDRNESWKPKVLPPRSEQKRGVFATRAPYRPNPIGLSVVKLESVHGLRLRVRGVDILDGTPVLDIKPYIPYTDCVQEASGGWLGGKADSGRRYKIIWGERAEEQLSFLLNRGVDLKEAISAILSVSPHPHPYRRIRIEGENLRRLALKEWRIWFSIDETTVHVQKLGSGYRKNEREVLGREVHRDFEERYR